MRKTERHYLRKIRLMFQWGILGLVSYAGVKFYFFVRHFETGGGLLPERPPLVDGFLPIGALMGLKAWLSGGWFDSVHPAAVVILISALLVSVFLKKGFCGYVCPVGTLSEAVFKTGGRLFGKNLRLPRFIDYPLRSVKYILMAFFLYVVLITMNTGEIKAFMDTPYWKVADVKMLHFFTRMTPLAFYVLLGLFVLSLPVKNFWCRYLCPYGALLGLLSFLSPFKVTRYEENCIRCGRCTENCPQMLPVGEKPRLRSPECTGCLTCVSVCPSEGALDMALPGRKRLNPALYMVFVAVLFFLIISAGRVSGKWRSGVTYEEYKAVIPYVSALQHP